MVKVEAHNRRTSVGLFDSNAAPNWAAESGMVVMDASVRQLRQIAVDNVVVTTDPLQVKGGSRDLARSEHVVEQQHAVPRLDLPPVARRLNRRLDDMKRTHGDLAPELAALMRMMCAELLNAVAELENDQLICRAQQVRRNSMATAATAGTAGAGENGYRHD